MHRKIGPVVITVLALVSLGLLLLRLIVSLVNLSMPVHLPQGKTLSNSSLSVLIPARNEEHNIGRLVQAVLAMHHQVEEVLIYDDGSTDRTWEIIREMQILDPRIRGIEGGKLPEGWLGKNYACHCLASEARGELLLFLDADVVPEAGLAGGLVSRMESQGLDLLSIFPVQRMQGMGEWMSVPLMNWILLSLLPLSLVRLSRRPSLSAANGQCMLFRASAYRDQPWHSAVRNEAVEDIRIVQRMKAGGKRVETLLSDGQIACRMYRSYVEAVRGFSKNIHHFFGGSYTMMALFALFTTTGPFWSALAFGWPGFLTYTVAALLTRWITAHLSRQPAWRLTLLHPLLHASMLYVMVNAYLAQRKGTLEWKGRKLGSV